MRGSAASLGGGRHGLRVGYEPGGATLRRLGVLGGMVATALAGEASDVRAGWVSEPSVQGATPAAAPLSGYFGANNVFPLKALTFCDLPLWKQVDGLPVVFPEQIDPASLSLTAFQVRVGELVTNPVCVLLEPATSAFSAATGYVMYDANQANSFENYTVLLAFPAATLTPGTAATVEVVGEVVSEPHADGSRTSFRASRVVATDLGAGPRLIHARRLSAGEIPMTAGTVPLVGTYCPSQTVDAALIVWQGGVTVSGAELTTAQQSAFTMTVQAGDGTLSTRMVDAIAEASGDGDNNLIICSFSGRIQKVSVAAHTVTDPSRYWNPATDVQIP